MNAAKTFLRTREISLTGSLLALLVIGVAPIAWMVASILASAKPSDLLSLIITVRQWHLLGNTIVLAFLVAIFTTLLGTLLGFLLAKTDVLFKNFFYPILMVPLFFPPYILALAWFYLLGKKGLIAYLIGARFGDLSSSFLFSFSGTIYVLTLAYYPVTMILAYTFVRAIDSSSEEAARLFLSWPKVMARIDLPLIAPGIFLGGLFTCILTISELGVPLFLRYDVFTVQVFTQFAAFYDYRAAVIFSIPLLMLILVMLLVERFSLRDQFFGVVGRKARSEASAPLGRFRIPISGLVFTFASLAVLLPICALFITSRSFSSYLEAISGSGQSITNSLLDAALAATAITVLGFFLAYLVERSRRTRRNGIDSLLILLFAVPGTVLGVGLILLWNHAATAFLYRTSLVILLGYTAKYTVLATRIQGIALRQVPKSYEEASRLARVRWGTEIIRIHIPTLRKALMASWLIAFIFCLRDLDTAITVSPPGSETLPVRIYTLMANSPDPVVAALSLILVLITLAALTATLLLFRKESVATAP